MPRDTRNTAMRRRTLPFADRLVFLFRRISLNTRGAQAPALTAAGILIKINCIK
jgi:hypothetical protein